MEGRDCVSADVETLCGVDQSEVRVLHHLACSSTNHRSSSYSSRIRAFEVGERCEALLMSLPLSFAARLARHVQDPRDDWLETDARPCRQPWTASHGSAKAMPSNQACVDVNTPEQLQKECVTWQFLSEPSSTHPLLMSGNILPLGASSSVSSTTTTGLITLTVPAHSPCLFSAIIAVAVVAGHLQLSFVVSLCCTSAR